MFDELPETKPFAHPKRKRAVVASAAVHLGLVAALILFQMYGPGSLAGVPLLTTTYMAPPPPPDPPPPPPAGEPERKAEPRAEKPSTERSRPVEEPKPVPVEKPTLAAPVEVPKDVAKVMDAAPGAGSTGTIGGVPGGVPGGIPGGVIGGQPGGVIGGMPEAPPPPPPKEPVRVGGAIREPKITKLVQPIYPPVAAKQHLQGVVVLEAVVTESGRVEKVRVISGPPALVDAAVQAVQQWQYEPTRLNGTPVAVILNAQVSFSLKNQ
jgi:protein TonB